MKEIYNCDSHEEREDSSVYLSDNHEGSTLPELLNKAAAMLADGETLNCDSLEMNEDSSVYMSGGNEDSETLNCDSPEEYEDDGDYMSDNYDDRGCEWTEEDSWYALTDGMYGDMPNDPRDYDLMMDSMGF